MADNNSIRSGSLQFYPRVRAKKVIPNVNWAPVSKEGVNILGFIGYKVGMVSVWARDHTEHSLTKNKRIIVPATILECPSMRIYSVRFYKGGKVMKDVVVTDDKALKKRVKLPKNKKELGNVEGFDDVRVVVYSGVGKTSVDKKIPDVLEIGISGNLDEKMKFIKEKIGKDISIPEVFVEGTVDIRGVTKGYGTMGPMKRFGISLKSHKSEKGRRRPGSLAPWHPARVTFRAPQAGQTGYHSRITYNNLILDVGKISEKNINKKSGFEHYGNIKTDYILLRGSIPGPKKRGLMITQSIRPTKKISKKKFEVLEIR
ncbi:MAG: 50S ribosomal protein L3 [archaeon]|nr:50S ribosomal protein L3 [archaeon]MCR4323809.1 50S ribosomal protein L3 [Nanoarchaeota archaeon]